MHVYVSFQRVLTPDANSEESAYDQDFLVCVNILQYFMILYMCNENPDHIV